MPTWRMQCSFGADTAFVRDRLVMTPHFDDHGIATDPDGLATDLATALAAWCGTAREIKVTAYDAQGTPPVYPQGEHIIAPTVVPASPHPREIAVCLSFYSERNQPRRRGRLFVPTVITGQIVTSPRPNPGIQNKVAELVPIFTDLGGPDVDWVVYSRVDDVSRPVTNWFIDNEWDTIRSRGLRPDARIVGTTSEL
jgi:hypothetical protein